MGCVGGNLTVLGSTTSMLLAPDRLAFCIAFCASRSKENFTSSAVMGDPSLNLMPSRSVNVQTCPPCDISHFWASQGIGLKFASRSHNGSNISSQTRTEAEVAEIAGSMPLVGSALAMCKTLSCAWAGLLPGTATAATSKMRINSFETCNFRNMTYTPPFQTISVADEQLVSRDIRYGH